MWLFIFIHMFRQTAQMVLREKINKKDYFFIAMMKHWKCSGNIAATLYIFALQDRSRGAEAAAGPAEAGEHPGPRRVAQSCQGDDSSLPHRSAGLGGDTSLHSPHRRRLRAPQPLFTVVNVWCFYSLSKKLFSTLFFAIKGTQAREFFGLWFWNLCFFVVSYA